MKLKDNPALMTVIINIQKMSKTIHAPLSFEVLEQLDSKDLHELQDTLIPDYNEAVKAVKQ